MQVVALRSRRQLHPTCKPAINPSLLRPERELNLASQLTIGVVHPALRWVHVEPGPVGIHQL